MEPQDLDGRELQAIKKRLCYISSTICALCLVCLATTLALFLSHRTTQGTCVQYPCNSTASAQLKCNCAQYPCNSVAYVQLKWNRKKTNSTLIMWKEGSLRNGMKYQDGNLTILSKGLYFINCRLHFQINKCLETHDLHTRLLVNEKAVYEVLTTVLPTNSSSCRIYKDQHLSLHIELNASDNLSVHTESPEWLNEENLPESIRFEAFKIQYK